MRRRRYSVVIGEMKIAGEDVTIRFDPDTNKFSANLLDEEFEDDRYSTLVNRLKKKGKEYKPTIAIPVTKIESGKRSEFEDLTVTGVHSANRNIMARVDATGEVVQLSRGEFADFDAEDRRGAWAYDRTPKYVRRLTADEKKAVGALGKAVADAEAALDKQIRSHKIAIMSEITKAQKREVQRQAEAVEQDADETDPRIKEIAEGLKKLQAKHGTGRKRRA